MSMTVLIAGHLFVIGDNKACFEAAKKVKFYSPTGKCTQNLN